MMSLAPELHQELANALKVKIERRFRQATRHGAPGAYDPKGAMSRLVRELADELQGEEGRYREKGDDAAAKAFHAVREELLDEVAAYVLAGHR
jgi:hypothetical protein